ncbi:hypothetical protein J2W49_002428 [Hydrogenophaga palleronii]|uniref:Uncharacterized protein n=1 Tax=Hydrogenophaga palleronii TaxID=65655 RepID=A0ABU1WME2_9BURK|nr:hypothetical protein [Hydrogenophaga palleronii]
MNGVLRGSKESRAHIKGESRSHRLILPNTGRTGLGCLCLDLTQAMLTESG